MDLLLGQGWKVIFKSRLPGNDRGQEVIVTRVQH